MPASLTSTLLVSSPAIPADLPQAYRVFYRELLAVVPAERIFTDPLKCLAYGTDASFYRLIPKLVVKVQSEEEVSSLLRLSKKHRLPVTFRAAGTSLSGQAITDSILVVLAGGWRKAEVKANGERIQLQPGVIGSHANQLLAPYGRKIGPDPASLNAAMIGGIAANNASGMCCGVNFNSYRTLHSLRVILGDGAILDTDDQAARERFARTHKALLSTLADYAERVRQHPTLPDRIRHKYKIKNTTGYSLNALIDFEDPIDILAHLMIGSEGTLGFIAEITYRTVAETAHKGTAMVLFPTMIAACEAVADLKAAPVDAVELLDRASLRSVAEQEGAPAQLRSLPENASALLIECGAATSTERDAKVQQVEEILATHHLLSPSEFTQEPAQAAKYWKIRKGLFPSVGNVRKAGTTVIIEDFAVPTERLAEAVTDLRQLFEKYEYREAIMFGHALEGNLHFCFTQDFNVPAEVTRYENLMEEVCCLLIDKYDGSLKAEHGTGRNMAPFVEKEWGRDAYELMEALKELFDPHNLLNPGVILNADPHAHLKHLKPLPIADPIVDKCIECGFCEPQCPSRDLTLTPRQRITAWREMAQLERDNSDAPRLRELRDAYRYDGEETCATDGLCATSCPVQIDTGKLVKQLRHDQQSRFASWAASLCERKFGFATQAARFGLGFADKMHGVLGTKLMTQLATTARKVSGNRLPQWNAHFPTAAPPIAWQLHAETSQESVVYFPSCICRMMGPERGSQQLSHPQVVQAVLERAGFSVVHPAFGEELCCGVAFDSKGFREQAQRKTRQLDEVLREASREGELPILTETSPCALRMKQELSADLRLFDPVDFVHEFLLGRLQFLPLAEPVVIHPTCSNQKAGQVERMRQIAAKCASEVIVPHTITCCGVAGDRAMTHPELTNSALAALQDQVPYNCSTGVSNSRTCEIGLSMNSNLRYESLFHLLHKATRS